MNSYTCGLEVRPILVRMVLKGQHSISSPHILQCCGARERKNPKWVRHVDEQVLKGSEYELSNGVVVPRSR